METWRACSRPPHMAQRRADFAAATPWFHGVQTGFWSTNAGDPRNTRGAGGAEEKYCTGLYVAGCPPAGRYIDAEVVISSINGAGNNAGLAAAREREMRHSMRSRVPVGIAVNKDAARPDAHGVQTFPCAVPGGLECAVLGWFVATHMWEKPGRGGGGVSVWMVRLEKIDIAARSWWADAKWAGRPHPGLEERDFTTKAADEACPACGEVSVRLFAPRFVCLNKHCRDWFLVDGEHADADPANLVYDRRFLAERLDRLNDGNSLHDAARRFWDFYPAMYPTWEQFLARNHPDAGQASRPSSLTPQNLAARNEALLAGFSCPQCGLANSRVDYHRWHCRNTDCRGADGNTSPFSYHAPPETVTPAFLALERAAAGGGDRAGAAPPLHELHGFVGTVELWSHTCHVFDFGGGCRLTLFRPRPNSVAAQMSDAVFEAVQGAAASGALGLARRSITANGGGGGLTNHFVENFGERYYLPFALGDNPMAGAPEVVRDALETANIYMGEYFGEDKRDEWEFNELYVAAYQSRRMHMSFHDDGERKLGHVIGTWTLGGHATFKMCIKPQYDYGRKSRDGAWMRPQDDGTVDPVPKGCTEEPFRQGLRAQFEQGRIDAAQWAAQLQQHMDAHMAGPQKGRGRAYAKRALVSFAVEHGDVVIMWGPNTQRLMEHAVECRSPMRFAVTLRRVTGDMATPRQWEALDRRLAADMAFTPPWAEGGAKQEEAAAEEEEDGDGGEPAAKKVKMSGAEEAGVGGARGEAQVEDQVEARPAGARVTRSRSKKARQDNQ
ncbi:hypothetical protein KVR01_009620 [Diaporthe batatas]|uniref:uncharacterized protein n=1 Tax=Diaporthe batatas TaxID=748121 RepID=UPI001D048DA1|nr:uncharacterized protein KVR01_009620 [Diaporthe batatas]KAG8161356.1 hypothetical protein KVR01_009620 [Diaporthe batatas]